MLTLEKFVTRRYLRRAEGKKEGKGFLRFILYVAVGGVAVGVAALLLALSIVRGFSLEIESKITGVGSHVQVESLRDAPLADASAIEEVIRSHPDAVLVAPVVQEFALLRRSSREIDGVAITGVKELPSYLGESIVSGSATLVANGDLPPLVVGETLRQRLGASLGDRVTVFSIRSMDGSVGAARPRIRQFVIGGVYETFLGQYDETYVYVGIDEARKLLEYGADEVSRFDVGVMNVEDAPTVASELEDELGFPVLARSIYELFGSLFAWVGLQQSIIPVVIAIIILVAAFNIVGVLLMIVLEKTGEIGILASMGASARQIRRLFMAIGVAIGLVGSAIGASLALVLALLQQRFGLIPLPAESYYMSEAPIRLDPVDFVAVCVVAVILCLVAAYIPARVGGRIEPVRVIRFR